MAKNVNVESDSSTSSAAGPGGTSQWHQNQQKSRSAVLMKAPWDAPPATPNFDGTCNDFKGHGIVFELADPHADRFMHVKREINEYISK